MAPQIEFIDHDYDQDQMPPTLPLFATEWTGWDDAQMAAIAAALNGKEANNSMNVLPYKVVVGDANKSVEFFNASPSLRWLTSDDALEDLAEPVKPWTPNGPDEPVAAGASPSPTLLQRRAAEVATDFLFNRGLGNKERMSNHKALVSFSQMRKQVVGSTAGAPLERCSAQVSYSFSVSQDGETYDLIGPGEKMQVTVSKSFEPVAFYDFHRNLRFLENMHVVDLGIVEAAVAGYLSKKGVNGHVEVTMGRPVYYAAPPRERQPFLVPGYMLRWKLPVARGSSVELSGTLFAPAIVIPAKLSPSSRLESVERVRGLMETSLKSQGIPYLSPFTTPELPR